MILRVASLIAFTATFVEYVDAEIAPEITTISDGYSIIAKLPCIGCPYLYQDPSSTDQNSPWVERKDENALLLNITLPFSSTHLSINTAALLTPSTIPPKIYANQVPLSTSKSDLTTMIESNSLDSPGSAPFALSYAYSLHGIQSSPNALLFHFDILQLWSDLPSPPVTVTLDNTNQKILQVVLLQQPLVSAADPSPAYSIIRAALVPRSSSPQHMRQVWFHEWDAHGKSGTSLHFFNRASDAVMAYASSGVWALFIFIAALMGLFVVLCLFCCFAVGAFSGEEYDYERAQVRKRMRKRGWRAAQDDVEKGAGDVEKGRGMGRLVGVGKSD
ncbi:hypothetical protein J1614_008789 [Plenodomus biglobosus]|nr:hypothetical protein J1614_008789 [Plenodomus biglobosus]